MRLRPPALLLALACAAPAAAQHVVTSPGPEAVSVTVYRDPSGRDMDISWLNGYALITETRTVTLPAGDSVIRFEGVAGNILPTSAIVRGLPREAAEKNYDARLLSAGALVDASLGRQVHIRRTSRATGKVTETEAIIRSGPDGIVLQTAQGFEALRCTGVLETLVYDEPPPGLSAKPTLAIATRSGAPTTATVLLSYLTTQFDWRANYVATLAADGRTLDLFAWLTLANGNDESFVDASAQVVAGRPNRDEDAEDDAAQPVSPQIQLRCWPVGTTSDVDHPTLVEVINSAEYAMTGDAIVVTGSRVRRANYESASPVTTVTAELEGLGDLKLYRIPVPVTVAANGQKQVALLHMERVRFERLYGGWIRADNEPDAEGRATQVSILLRTKNVTGKGLGKPLPSGNVAVFEQALGSPMLIGEAPLHDTPVGQDLEILVGESSDLAVIHKLLPDTRPRPREGEKQPVGHEIIVTNGGPAAVDVELGLGLDEEDYRLIKPSRKLTRKNGGLLWRAHVPANGTVRLTYLVEEKPPRRAADDE